MRVILPDGNAATYHYDAVGNILSITRETGVSQSITVDTQSATTGAQGQVVPLTITGSNLSGAAVVCAAPGITIQNTRTDFGQLTLEMMIAANAPTGSAQCEVRGISTSPIAFAIATAIPAFGVSHPVSVRVATPATPFVASAVSVRVATAVTPFVPSALSVRVAPTLSDVSVEAVAVSFQPVVTSVSPATGAPATPSLAVRVLGAGLGGATNVTFLRNNVPDSSITVVTFSVTPDGTEADLTIAIAPSAPVGARAIQITVGSRVSTPLGTGGNLFTVQ